MIYVRQHNAGVIYQHIYPAKVGDGGGKQLPAGLHGQRVLPDSHNCRPHGLGRAAGVIDYYMGSGLGRCLGDGRANPREAPVTNTTLFAKLIIAQQYKVQLINMLILSHNR